MDFLTPVRSFWKVFFGIDLTSTFSVLDFEVAMENELQTPCITIPNARYGLLRTLEFLKIDSSSGVLMTPINLPDMRTIIKNTGAELRFVKYLPKSFELDLESIVVKKTDRIFFFTPLAGIIPDMDEITTFCDKNDLILVIDFTQSFMATYKSKPIHQFSDFSFSSLCDLKVIHTHRGGIYASRNRDFTKFLRDKESELNPIDRRFFMMSILEDALSLTLLRPMVFKIITRWVLKILSLKRGDNVEAITSGQGIKILGFRFLKGFFQSNQVQLGEDFPSFLFYRFSDLQAKIGLKRLKSYRRLEERRINNAQLFYRSLKGSALNGIPGEMREGNCYWKTPLWIESPKKFKLFMTKWGVDCSQTNLPLLYNDEDNNERNMRDHIVYMPTHWYLKEKQVKAMAEIVNEYYKESYAK